VRPSPKRSPGSYRNRCSATGADGSRPELMASGLNSWRPTAPLDPLPHAGFGPKLSAASPGPCHRPRRSHSGGGGGGGGVEPRLPRPAPPSGARSAAWARSAPQRLAPGG
jgi:hypothetical protein